MPPSNLKQNFSIRNQNVIQTIFHEDIYGRNFSELDFKSKELHVFVPDESKLGKSVDLFHALFNQRSYFNLEHWMMDISNWKSMNDFRETFKNLKLDYGKYIN